MEQSLRNSLGPDRYRVIRYYLVLVLSIRMDLHAKWSSNYVNLLYFVSLAGVPFVLWLVLVELTMVDGAPHICPYCTVIHIALLGMVASAFYLRQRKETGLWS